MADEIAGAKNDIADLLAPYGYYFVGNDDRAELHLVFADLGIAALAVLAWSAAQYLKSFLTETGKLHAQGLAPKNSASADSPEKHVNDMILDQLKLFSAELRSSERRAAFDTAALEARLDIVLNETRARRAILPPSTIIGIEKNRLASYVAELGASKGRAEEIAAEIGPTLEDWLDRLTRPSP